MLHVFTAAVFRITTKWEQPKHPARGKWINYGIFIEYNLAIKNNKITDTKINTNELQMLSE